MTDIRYGRVLGAGTAAIGSAWIIVFLVVTAYAVKLGFEARGQPDQAEISAFAERIGPWLGPLALALMSLIAAFVVARSVPRGKMANGVAVGVVAGIVSLILSLVDGFDAGALVGIAIPVAMASLGGFIAARVAKT